MDAAPEPRQTEQGAAERIPARRAACPTSQRGRPAAGLGQLLGNRSLARVLARLPADGEGLLDGGVVHPAVQHAVAMAAGDGRPLGRRTAERLEPAFGVPLDGVRVHDGPQAQALARAVSARAFTVGQDVFFGAGEHRPGTPDGDALMAHEVAHAVQQRGAPDSGPLTVTTPGDATERDAEAAVRGLDG